MAEDLSLFQVMVLVEEKTSTCLGLFFLGGGGGGLGKQMKQGLAHDIHESASRKAQAISAAGNLVSKQQTLLKLQSKGPIPPKKQEKEKQHHDHPVGADA
jgi:hypothetical protein